MKVLYEVKLPWFHGKVVLSKDKKEIFGLFLKRASPSEPWVVFTEWEKTYRCTPKNLLCAIDMCNSVAKATINRTWTLDGPDAFFERFK